MSDSLMPLGTDKNANCPFKQFSKFGETYIMEKQVIEMYRNDVLFGRGEGYKYKVETIYASSMYVL